MARSLKKGPFVASYVIEKVNQMNETGKKEVIKRLTARGRADDKPDIIRQRLATHEKETGPVIKHYEDKLINIKAEDKTPEEIAGDIIKKVESRS